MRNTFFINYSHSMIRKENEKLKNRKFPLLLITVLKIEDIIVHDTRYYYRVYKLCTFSRLDCLSGDLIIAFLYIYLPGVLSR